METQGLTKATLRKNTDSGKRESCKATRNQGRRKFQKGGWMYFKKEGMLRTKCFRRPGEVRTGKGILSLAIMRPWRQKQGL